MGRNGGHVRGGYPVATCRTLLDALRSTGDPVLMAQLVRAANRAFALCQVDEYWRQCKAIGTLVLSSPTQDGQSPLSLQQEGEKATEEADLPDTHELGVGG